MVVGRRGNCNNCIFKVVNYLNLNSVYHPYFAVFSPRDSRKPKK